MTRPMRSICPWCRHRHDMASGVAEKGESEPVVTNGAFSFCAACGEIAVFDLQLPTRLRFPSLEEWSEATTLPLVLTMMAAWRDTISKGIGRARQIQHKPEWLA